MREIAGLTYSSEDLLVYAPTLARLRQCRRAMWQEVGEHRTLMPERECLLVRLTDDQNRFCDHAVERIHGFKHPDAVSQRFHKKRSEEETTRLMVVPELVVCTAFGIPYRLKLEKGGDKHRADLVLTDEAECGYKLTANVKYAGETAWDFKLFGKDPSEFNADVGILVVPYKGGHLIKGFMWDGEFFRDHKVHPFNAIYGPKAYYPAYLLRSIGELIEDFDQFDKE